jgi:hypothetical protein
MVVFNELIVFLNIIHTHFSLDSENWHTS